MKIDRSNYEIWIIDWLDGHLNEVEIGRLQFFLNENPELKAEFDELTLVSLNPGSQSFKHKNNLKKTTSDLTDSQFEYLSVGYLENDLLPDQKIELIESIEHDLSRKETFELIQKTRITPVELLYKNKKVLLRRTASQKVLRLTLIGLSAAAVIALALFTYISKPKALQVKPENTAQIFLTDTASQKPDVKIVSDEVKRTGKIGSSDNPRRNLSQLTKKSNISLPETGNNSHVTNSSLVRPAGQAAILPHKIPVSSRIALKEESTPKTLIALNLKTDVPESDDGRSRIRKFIAKTFREKVLKDNTKQDSPLKAFEFAEAGISGLNKLLGWEMVLDEKKGLNGEPESVYFSSKILKFKAPVKKSEPLP